MHLFNDIDLFTTPKCKKTIFDLPDTDLVLYEGFFDKADSDYYYTTFLHQTNWRESKMTIYDKEHTIPRMIAWYEDKDNPGANPSLPDWTPELLTIRKKIEAESEVPFNSVLLNLYRDGKDGVGWHSDRDMHFESHAIIASVSFGETRPFRLRHKFRKEFSTIEIPLHHGSFLLMAGTTQRFWEHQIPKTSKDILPRINLTFRRVRHQI